MRIPVNPKKQKQREDWHKIVVKVIKFRGGYTAGNPTEKITLKEWKTYCSGILKSNLTSDKTIVKQNLKQIEESIKNSNGFAEL